MRRLLAAARRDTGASLTEYLALLGIIGLIVAGLALNAGGVGTLLATRISAAVCSVIGLGCGTSGIPGAPGSPGSPGIPGVPGPRDPSAPLPLPDGIPGVPGPGADPGLGEGPGGGAHGTDPSGEQSDPVNSLTGAFVTTGLDAALPGHGVSFTLQRSYDSASATAGWLGRGWRLGFEMAVRATETGATVVTETGQRLAYALLNGDYRPAPGVRSTLTATAGGWELRRPDAVTYAFDGDGRLLAVVDPAGNGLELEYAGGTLARVTDAAGRAVSFDADGQGRVTGVTLPDGGTLAYGYTGALLTSVTDPRGGVTRYAYEDDGRIAAVTDATGATTVRNRYGDDGRVVEQVDALGHTSTFTWDPASTTQTMVDARGGAWSHVYRDGVLVARVDPLAATTTFTYDADLNVVAVTDPLGATARIDYDRGGRPVAVTRPDGEVERFAYDRDGLLVELTDAAGGTTTVERDELGRVVAVELAEGSRVAIDYDAEGRPVAVTDPAGAETRVGYDDAGNLATLTTPGGSTLVLDHDTAGRTVRLVDPRGQEDGADPDAFAWTYDWDAAGNLVAAVDPLGATSRVERDAVGRVTATTDPTGAATRYRYDPMGRMLLVAAPDGSATTYTYDAGGNVASRTTPLGHTTRYAYDAANRLTGVTAPGGQHWGYGYDLAGRATTSVLPSGTATPEAGDGTVRTAYDVLGRVTAITYSDGTPAVGYAYDAVGNLVEVRDGLGTLTRTYDPVGRVLTVERDGLEVAAYTYDPAGRPLTRTFGNQVSTTAYTADGLPESVTDGPLEATYAYDAAGHLLRTDFGNGTVELRGYDDAGRLVAMAAEGPDGTLASAAYAYDPLGNPLVAQYADRTVRYAYDQRQRLVAACTACDGSDGVGFGYDAASRRTSVTTPAGATNFAYDASDRMVAAEGADGEVTLTYDADGNLAGDGQATYAYNLAGQLTRATPAGGAGTDYAYDGLGHRVAAGDTSYAWDDLAPHARLAAEERDGEVLRGYGFGAGRIGFTGPDGEAQYLHADALGSVLAVSGEDGAADWRYDYSPFGSREAEQLDPGAAENPIGFTGELTDGGGRLHLRARSYDPELGAFLQVDPVSATAAQPYASVYSYAGNRPTAATDPSGACPFCPDIDLPDISLPDVDLPSPGDVIDGLGNLPVPLPGLPIPIGPVADVVGSVIDDPWGALETVTGVSGWIATGAGVVAASAGACSALVVTLPVCGTIAAGAGTVALVTGGIALGGGAILAGRDCANYGIGSAECITAGLSTAIGAGNTALGRIVRNSNLDELAQAGIGLAQTVGGRLVTEGLNWIEDLLTDGGAGGGK